MLTFLVLVPHLALAELSLPGQQPSSVTLVEPDASRPFCVAGVCRDALKVTVIDAKARASRLTYIHEEILKLEGSRPSQALPVISTVFGSLCLISAAVLGLMIFAPFLTTSLLILAGSTVPLTFGLVFLSVYGGRNRRINDQLRDLRAERTALSMVELAQF